MEYVKGIRCPICGYIGTGKSCKLHVKRRTYFFCKTFVRSDEHGTCRAVMLKLREKVGGDIFGV